MFGILLLCNVSIWPSGLDHGVQKAHMPCTSWYIGTTGSIDQHIGLTSFLMTNVEVKSCVTSLGTSGQFWAHSFQVFTHFQSSQENDEVQHRDQEQKDYKARQRNILVNTSLIFKMNCWHTSLVLALPYIEIPVLYRSLSHVEACKFLPKSHPSPSFYTPSRGITHL